MVSAPSAIFHYTTQLGLLGILQTDSLWATKVHYLNDTSEYRLALDLANTVLQRLLKGERGTTKRRKIKTLIDNARTIEKMNVCVCSFSAQRDLLSQWRAYAGHVGGYSIGFRTSHVKAQAALQGFDLVKCVYEESQQQQLVEKLVDSALQQDFNTDRWRVDPDQPNTLFVLATGGDFAFRLAALAPVIKNKAFYEEDEWRLISTKGVSFKDMSFRQGRSMLTPYVPFALTGEKAAYLDSIVVGPTPHTNLAIDATESLLAHWGVSQSASVSSSKVPYRAW